MKFYITTGTFRHSMKRDVEITADVAEAIDSARLGSDTWQATGRMFIVDLPEDCFSVIPLEIKAVTAEEIKP